MLIMLKRDNTRHPLTLCYKQSRNKSSGTLNFRKRPEKGSFTGMLTECSLQRLRQVNMLERQRIFMTRLKTCR